MKRVLTLTGTIISTVAFSIYSIFNLLIFIASLSLAEFAGAGVVIAIAGIDLAFAITCLVLNAVSISTWNKSPELYKKKKGIIISTMVFNYIYIVLGIISLIIMNPTVAGRVLTILLIICVIVANVLITVDFANESKNAAKYEEVQAEQDETTMKKASAKQETEVESLDAQLDKLTLMKTKGQITEEEYSELKKKLISKSLD